MTRKLKKMGFDKNKEEVKSCGVATSYDLNGDWMPSWLIDAPNYNLNSSHNYVPSRYGTKTIAAWQYPGQSRQHA